MGKISRTIRMNKHLDKKVDDHVESGLYDSRIDVIEDSLDVIANMNPDIRKTMDFYCDRLGLTHREFVEGVIADWSARKVAFEKVWGHPSGLPLLEFAKYDGQVETGAALIGRLAEHHAQELSRQRVSEILFSGDPGESENFSAEDRAFLLEQKQGLVYWRSPEGRKALEERQERAEDIKRISQFNRGQKTKTR